MTEEEKRQYEIMDVTKEKKAAGIIRALGEFRVPLFVGVEEQGDKLKICNMEDDKCIVVDPKEIEE